MNYIFLDAEYAYTCSAREGQIPNYKNLIDMFNQEFPKSEIIAYHVGDKDKKRGVCDFLCRSGVDYNAVLEFRWASKTQLVGAAMAIDAIKFALQQHGDSNFVFLTADDYLIPIVEALNRINGIKIHVYCFPSLVSRELDGVLQAERIKRIHLSNRYFTYPKK